MQVQTSLFPSRLKDQYGFQETHPLQARNEEAGREIITLYTDCDVRINALPSIFQTNFLYVDGE